MTKASEWAERVEAWRASGQSAPEYCAGREYSSKTLLWWSSRLRRKGAPARARSRSEAVHLARVVPAAGAVVRSAQAIVVQVGSARVEVPHGTERATLAAVFEALGVAVGAVAP
jgi:transposase